MRELAALERDNNNHDRMLCETIEDQKRVNPAMEHIAKASGMADFCARARLRYETEEKQDQFAAYARRAQSGDISVYNQWGKKAMEGRMGLPEFGKLGDACPIFYQGALRKDTASTVSLAYYCLGYTTKPSDRDAGMQLLQACAERNELSCLTRLGEMKAGIFDNDLYKSPSVVVNTAESLRLLDKATALGYKPSARLAEQVRAYEARTGVRNSQ